MKMIKDGHIIEVKKKNESNARAHGYQILKDEKKADKTAGGDK